MNFLNKVSKRIDELLESGEFLKIVQNGETGCGMADYNNRLILLEKTNANTEVQER